MSTYDILDILYECYENCVPVSYRSLINTLEYHDIPFSSHAYETITEVRTPYERYPRQLSQCAIDINIELYREGSRIIITMVNDYITEMRRELSMANMFMNCKNLRYL